MNIMFVLHEILGVAMSAWRFGNLLARLAEA